MLAIRVPAWGGAPLPRCFRNASQVDFACGGFVSKFMVTSSDNDPIDWMADESGERLVPRKLLDTFASDLIIPV